MATDVSEDVIVKFFESISKRDFDTMEHYLLDDAQLYFPKTQPLIGRERILKFFNLLFRQYSQLNFQIQKIIIQGNNAAVHWRNQGVTRKNEAYENEGVTLMEFRDRKVSYLNDFFKDTGKF